jgi:hypothetical protein
MRTSLALFIRSSHRILEVGLTALALLESFGCAAEKMQPEVTISWLGPAAYSARPPDCRMRVLYTSPNTDYLQIAMVDVVAAYDTSDQTILELVRRKACETGADAVIIASDRRQSRGEPLPGYAAGEPNDLGPQSGANISQRQHNPELGEVGHEGRYVNGIAIIYKNRRSASDIGSF